MEEMASRLGLKDILVHIDDTAQGRRRLAAAVTLAAAHDAHLIGLYVVTQPQIPAYIRTEIPEEILRHQAHAVEAAAARTRHQFEEEIRLAGLNGEWRQPPGPAATAVGLHGRYADIAIVGQRDPSGEVGSEDPAMPDQLILSIGRPVLVIPAVGDYPAIGERVMVAWDASRLATRAVNDALPFLARARQVVVIAVNPPAGEAGEGEIPSADICLHLARHGIRAEAQHIYSDDISIGAMLLSRAAEQGIDLLVTGAYGHARWREIVLGGVTRHMLRHMTIPVLMCH
jgi:nucleotide-binding universal stress UspA family protein